MAFLKSIYSQFGAAGEKGIVLQARLVAWLMVLAVIGCGGTHLSAADEVAGKDGEKPRVANCGSLTARAEGETLGACPLKHTRVACEISGFVATTEVTQEFHNPYDKPIEAVYVFPLPENGAVDDMTMRVGERLIRAKIKKREEAKAIYDKAIVEGKRAALLDQERPNIFTQRVGNIMPGDEIRITIRVVETLSFEEGVFTWTFPTVVGPRFIPGTPTAAQGDGDGFAPDTDQVPDASRITPKPALPGTRAGHDIEIEATIRAGVNVGSVWSELHEIKTQQDGGVWHVRLARKDEIPNRDFVLRFLASGDEVASGVIAHRVGEEDGYVTFVLLPPKRPTLAQTAPKEMLFIVDRSGSQGGEPLAKAKAVMLYAIANMNPADTFQILSFSSETEALFDKPQKNTAETRAQAEAYVRGLNADGGTHMAEAIRAACATRAPENRLRIVTMMTDGYIGNDFEILGMVKALRGNSRWFPFGTGNSVNRFLLDRMAKVGGGEAEYVLLNSSESAAGAKFYERIRTPVLTDILLEFDGLDIVETYPKAAGDLWADKPLIVTARYRKPGKGAVVLRGYRGAEPYEQRLEVELPEERIENGGIASVWARRKVEFLMQQDWTAQRDAAAREETKQAIVETALTHNLMTQYTSFVAVEQKVVNKEGAPKRKNVPVEVPDGVDRKGVFGDEGDQTGEPAACMVVSDDMVETVDIEIGDPENISDVDSEFVGTPALMGVGASGGKGGAGSFGRCGSGRIVVVRRGGGSRHSESAVDWGLRWLADHQSEDGHWDAAALEGGAGRDIEVTSMALLAFVGHGNSERFGKYRDNVRRAAEWLCKQRQPDGLIGKYGAESALALKALCETYGMSQNSMFKGVCEKALTAVCRTQIIKNNWPDADGGWDKAAGAWGAPENRAMPDVMLTVLYADALFTAKQAGLKDNATTAAGIARAAAFLKKQIRADGTVTASPDAKESDPRLTAPVLAVLLKLGESREDETLKRMAQAILADTVRLPGGAAWEVGSGLWQGEGFFRFGIKSTEWQTYNPLMKKALMGAQVKEGTFAEKKGSWEPGGDAGPHDQAWGRAGVTAISVRMLEVYYAYAK